MLRVTLTEEGANRAPDVREFAAQEITIGRDEKNDLPLRHRRVSGVHARVQTRGDEVLLVDDGSTNGTFVNGSQIQGTIALTSDQVVEIGPFSLRFEVVQLMGPPIIKQPAQTAPRRVEVPVAVPVREMTTTDPRLGQAEALERAFSSLQGEFAPGSPINRSRLEERALQTLRQSEAFTDQERASWATRLVREIADAGPLADLVRDAHVSEFFVHGAFALDITRRDKKETHPFAFSCSDAARLAIERLSGEQFAQGSGMINVQLPGGGSLRAVDRGLSATGPVALFKRYSAEPASLSRFVAKGTLSDDASRYLQRALQANRSILICGAVDDGSPKALAEALAAELPPSRTVVVRRGELWDQGGAVVLNGHTDMARAVQSALLLLPDWLIVLELAGPEVADVCAGTRRTSGGTISTTRADSAGTALDQLTTMVSLRQGYFDPEACRRYVASCFDVVIDVQSGIDGFGTVAAIWECQPSGDNELIQVFARQRGGPLMETRG